MKVNKKDYSTIWLEKNKVKIIDQTKLPFKFVIKELSSLKSFFNAIKKMVIPNDIDNLGIQKGIANKPGLMSSKINEKYTKSHDQ